ncbi:HNH endonuclease family protein [Actinacidiphila glaucinigra]|uniref:HNH endonuclease family protein n=1 Tax=Actinacidiphila glaucinigra TaxID=235986 RepID=UPI0033A51472
MSRIRSALARRSVYARRRLGFLMALTSLFAGFATLNGPTAQAALPTPVSAATARTYLASLKVATENRTGYNRDLFPHWITISGACNTRETVLKRDGSGVVTDSACAATSGSWYSVYDGATWTAAADLDIDHLVPLAEAWDSGASAWTTAKRQSFANDLTRPQLIAVTDNVNQAKGDQDPATWMPSRTAYACTYVRAWVQVKYYYGLSVDSAEKSKLSSVLSGC